MENKTKKVKIKRFIEIVENIIKHMNNVHNNVTINDWNVDIITTNNGFTINMNVGEIIWKKHKDDIIEALRCPKQKKVPEHTF